MNEVCGRQTIAIKGSNGAIILLLYVVSAFCYNIPVWTYTVAGKQTQSTETVALY